MAVEPIDTIDAEPAGSAASPGEAPYLKALEEYARRDPGRFHVPAHKGGAGAPRLLAAAVGPATLALDVPSCVDGIDVGTEPSALERAEHLAAEAWGARRTWFLVNGASEASQVACLALAHLGDEVIVQRNVHSSTIHGLVLSGLRPVFVPPGIDHELGIPHCVGPEAMTAALDAAPRATAAIVVSPTYFGAAADLRGVAAACHDRGVPLIVDEAWGSHFRFHPALPEDALSAGADLVISGTHKWLGSLTQSAMLHLGRRDWPQLGEGLIARALGLVRTTSPSSLLLGSLDAARAEAVCSGAGLLERAVGDMARVKHALYERVGLETLDERLIGRDGVHAVDPLRLAIDVRPAGIDAYVLAAGLAHHADVQLELVTDRVLIAHFGVAEPVWTAGLRLIEGLELVLHGLERRGATAPPPAPLRPYFGVPALAPRTAAFAAHDLVPLSKAAGRISGESIVVYPPGIANVLPGERFTDELVAYLAAMVARGCSLRGTWDGEAPIRVVRERA